jgi:RNA polymerase sigma factor (sigma-70 family)
MTTEASDESLMSAYAAGQAAALEELFARYAPILLRVLRRQMATPEEAEDLVQQTFLQIHRARYDFDATQRFRPWAFTIALNLRREHFRRFKRRAEWPLEHAAEAHSEGQPAARTDAARDLDRALAALPSEQREAIELHWLEGLSFQEVAAVQGGTRGAAMARAHRGYNRVRAVLAGAYAGKESFGDRTQTHR